MMNKTKKWTIACAAFLMTAFAGLGVHTAINAQAIVGDTAFANFDMEYGASVRYTSSSTSLNGLRFGVSMPKSEYEALLQNTDYTNVLYGVLIAPEDMLTEGNELTESNVFGGASAKYDWAEWTEDGWVYNGSNGENGSKKRIINVNSAELIVSAEDPNKVEYWGAIINIKAEADGVNNLAREFRGVGYISYLYKNEQKYVLVGDEDNVRSMAYVAQQAIADGNKNSSWLQSNYVDKVTNVQSDYTVEYYLQTGDSYILQESVVVDTATIDDSVSATEKTYWGYEFDASNTKNILSGTVLANDGLVLKRYYNAAFEAFADTDTYLVDTAEEFDLVELLTENNKTDALNLINDSASLGELTVEADGQKIADVTALKGVCDITAKRGNVTVYTGAIDFYDATEGFVWVDNDALNLQNMHLKASGMTKEIVEKDALSEEIKANAADSQYFYITDESALMFSVSGLHSKAYYEAWQEKGITKLKVDVYSKEVNLKGGNYFNVPGVSTAKYIPGGATATDLFWVTLEIPMSTIISNFDYYSNTEEDEGGLSAEKNMITAGNNANNYHIYVGNFRGDIASPYEDMQLNLANTNGVFDFDAMLAENNNTAAEEFMAQYQSFGALTVEIDGKEVDVSTLEGVYEITAKRGGITLYTGEVDFYDETDGCVWINNGALDMSNLHLKGAGMYGSIINKDAMIEEVQSNPKYSVPTTTGDYNVDPTAGAQAEQYYVIDDHKTNANSYFVFSVGGIHSKAYYEMWAAKGVTTLKYDVYSISSQETSNVFTLNGVTNQYIPGTRYWKWYTVSVEIAKVIANYDQYITDSYFAGEQNMLFANTHAATYTMYVGNFRME